MDFCSDEDSDATAVPRPVVGPVPVALVGLVGWGWVQGVVIPTQSRTHDLAARAGKLTSDEGWGHGGGGGETRIRLFFLSHPSVFVHGGEKSVVAFF